MTRSTAIRRVAVGALLTVAAALSAAALLVPAAAQAAPSAPPTAPPTPAQPGTTSSTRFLTPVVDCVADAPLDGTATITRTIVFGYRSTAAKAVTLIAGPENFVSNGPADRGQPSAFAAGDHHGVWTLTVDTADTAPVWTIGSRSAAPGPATPPCTAATALALSVPTSTTAGGVISVTAAVSRLMLSAPSDGRVEFTIDGAPAATAPVAGGGLARAELTVPGRGSHTIGARYAPVTGSALLESRAQATVAVGDTSGALVISAAGASADGTSALVQVSRATAAGAASADVLTADGTGLAGTDYTATRSTVTLQDGQTTTTIAIPVKARQTGADSVMFFVLLQRATARVDVAGATITLAAGPVAGAQAGATVVATPPRVDPPTESVLPAGDPTAPVVRNTAADVALMLGAGVLTVGGIAGVVGLFRIGGTRNAQA